MLHLRWREARPVARTRRARVLRGIQVVHHNQCLALLQGGCLLCLMAHTATKQHRSVSCSKHTRCCAACFSVQPLRPWPLRRPWAPTRRTPTPSVCWRSMAIARSRTECGREDGACVNQDPTYAELYKFKGGTNDGCNPGAKVTLDAAGKYLRHDRFLRPLWRWRRRRVQAGA